MSTQSKSELIEHIDRLADGDEPPTQIKFELDDKSPSISPVETQFGSWNEALCEAGYPPNNNKKYTDEELIKHIIAYGGVDYKPKYIDFKRKGNHPAAGTISDRFGSWDRALKKAGYDIRAKTKAKIEGTSRDEVINKLTRINGKVDGNITVKDLINEEFAPSPVTVATLFNDLDEAKKAAGL